MTTTTNGPGQAAAADRLIPLQGARNVRHLGGFPTRDGRRTRPAVLRGDGISRLTDADVQVLADTGVTVVVDFRGDGEIASAGADRLPPGTRWVHAPIADDSSQALSAAITSAFDTGDGDTLRSVLGDGRAEEIARRGLAAHLDRPAAMDGYAQVVREVAGTPGTVLFHCAGGKDRTGMMAAIGLGLVGVDDDEIVADYLASNRYNAQRNEAMYARLAGHGIDPELVRPLLEQHPEGITGMLAEMRRRHGGWDAFAVDSLGLEPDTIAAFRGRLLG